MPSLWLNRVESPSPLYVLLVESAQSLVSLTSPSSSQNVNVLVLVFFEEQHQKKDSDLLWFVLLIVYDKKIAHFI